jgi:replication-associated recombination protein RarA
MQNGVMYSRLVSPPKGKSFFLFGPRGTGKTTWVKVAFPGSIYIETLKQLRTLLAGKQPARKSGKAE